MQRHGERAKVWSPRTLKIWRKIMLTVCGGLMAIVSSYSMLVSANEIYIPGFAILATAGGLAILVDMLHRHCRNI